MAFKKEFPAFKIKLLILHNYHIFDPIYAEIKVIKEWLKDGLKKKQGFFQRSVQE